MRKGRLLEAFLLYFKESSVYLLIICLIYKWQCLSDVEKNKTKLVMSVQCTYFQNILAKLSRILFLPYVPSRHNMHNIIYQFDVLRFIILYTKNYFILYHNIIKIWWYYCYISHFILYFIMITFLYTLK